MKKQQRFYHGKNAADAAYKSDRVDIRETRIGCGDDPNCGYVDGWWITDEDGDMIYIKNQRLGPAANIAIVAFFSCAGVIALYLFAPGVFYGIVEFLKNFVWLFV